jgi:hypothetical protein
MELKLKGISLPKMLSDLTYKYHVLVVITVGSMIVSAFSAIGMIAMSAKAPTVLALSSRGDIFDRSDLPKPEDEIKQAISHYVNYRYKWNAKTVVENIKKAESFIDTKSLAAFPGVTVKFPAFSVPITVNVLAEALEPNTIFVSSCKVELAATVKLETVIADPEYENV